MDITLTPEQVARIKANLDREAAQRRAAETFGSLLNSIQHAHLGLEPQLWHSGGNLWMIRIDLSDVDVEIEDEVEHPFILVSKAEIADKKWTVGGYLHFEDEAGQHLAHVETDGGALTHVIQAVSALRDAAEAHQSLVDASKPPISRADAVQWLIERINNGELGEIWDEVTGHGWTAAVLVPATHLTYVEDDTLGQVSAHFATIIRLRQEGEEFFVLYWHDGVVNEWAEDFDTYAEAAHRFGLLFEAAVRVKTFGELEPPEPPAILDHYNAEHPDEMIDVRVWWSVPYGGVNARLSKDRTQLVVRYDLGKSGDGAGPSEFHCNLCDAALSLGELIETDHFDDIELEWT